MIVPVAVAVGGRVAVPVAVAVSVGPPGVFVPVAVAVGGGVSVAVFVTAAVCAADVAADDVAATDVAPAADVAATDVAAADVAAADVATIDVLATHGAGGAVTTMETLTKTVRALSPTIGSGGVSSALRRIKGTMRGTIGKKSPLMITTRRDLLVELGLNSVASKSSPGSQNSYCVVPGPES